MTAPIAKSPPQRSDRLELSSDVFFPLCFVLFALALCLHLWAPGPIDPARPPVVFGSWLAGMLIARLYGHRVRALGFVIYGMTGAVIVLFIAGYSNEWTYLAVGSYGVLVGMAWGAVLSFRAELKLLRWRFYIFALVGAILAVALIVVYRMNEELRPTYQALLLGLTILAAILAWPMFARSFFELSMEFPTRYMYRLQPGGPGWKQLPKEGPCIVIANHGAYLDPVFLGKYVPRATTPMMTASFYDSRYFNWLFARVFNVIRVPEVAMRREAPEVLEAVAALDLGKCVVLFPEGYLRRTEDRPLRRFGQGIWQILKERPNTPVVACWIEGSWGSYFSFFNGPPMRNKKFDCLRLIRVAASVPEIVPAEILADGWRTRIHLMNRVIETRQYLGLPTLPPFELPEKDEKDDADTQT